MTHFQIVKTSDINFLLKLIFIGMFFMLASNIYPKDFNEITKVDIDFYNSFQDNAKYKVVLDQYELTTIKYILSNSVEIPVEEVPLDTLAEGKYILTIEYLNGTIDIIDLSSEDILYLIDKKIFLRNEYIVSYIRLKVIEILSLSNYK